ncbi:MAG: queuosine precursor transporter [Bacteroidetes bacterium]|nr:queuosine precursor transporter [Bacteroidota bacterium]
MKDKASKLFVILGGFFVTNALLAEIIGVKIFSVEETLGIEPFTFSFFGEKIEGFNMTAGVLLWPVVFVMTDIINEYFGKKGVRMLSFMTAGLILYAFLMIQAAIYVVPAEWWVVDKADVGVPDQFKAFKAIFGQGSWIIAGSIVAFLIGQMTDVISFRYIRKFTGKKMIWLRATGSTLISQLIDSFVVLFIAFYIGNDWSFKFVMAIALTNYIYKFVVAILSTPLIYAVHYFIEKYLGIEKAEELAESV